MGEDCHLDTLFIILICFFAHLELKTVSDKQMCNREWEGLFCGVRCVDSEFGCLISFKIEVFHACCF